MSNKTRNTWHCLSSAWTKVNVWRCADCSI